jgi:hypothetical protein
MAKIGVSAIVAANQVTEACGWEQAPRYLIRDRDGAYGEVFIRRLRSMGIRDRPTSPHGSLFSGLIFMLPSIHSSPEKSHEEHWQHGPSIRLSCA